MHQRFFSLLPSFALLGVACGGGDPGPTYHADVRPIVEQNCTGCHQAGAIAPFALTSFAAAAPHKEAMVAAVSARTMPPWRAVSDCHPLEGDRRLSDADMAVFEAWARAGYVEGDPASFKARPPLAGITPPAAEPDIEVALAEPFTAPNSATDTYQCFLLPYTFDKDTYIQAIDVRPDQHSVVHHVQIHTFPSSSKATVEGFDAAAPGSGYLCGGTVPGDTNIYSWRPGAPAVQMLDGDAMLVTAGTGLYLQVHYNIQSLPPGQTPPADRTSVAFWTLKDGRRPQRLIVRASVMAPVNIKAGESHVVSSVNWPAALLTSVGGVQLPAEIIGQTPHMHGLGTRLSAQLVRGGTEQCLIDVPHWSFEWQQDYLFAPDAAVAVQAGDSVKVTCEWDNSPANQPVLQGQKIAPRDVKYGEGTYDEMCLDYSWVRFDRAAYEAALAGQ